MLLGSYSHLIYSLLIENQLIITKPCTGHQILNDTKPFIFFREISEISFFYFIKGFSQLSSTLFLSLNFYLVVPD